MLNFVSSVFFFVSTVLTIVSNLFSYVIEKIPPTDRAFPTLFKQIQRKYFFDQGIEFVSISSVKVFFPTYVIWNKDSGDVHKFCTTLMEKTVGEIGILNSDLFSDQFFLQCMPKLGKREMYNCAS